MANTTKLTAHYLMITGLDADWDIPTDLADMLKNGLWVRSIHFHPSATDDIAIVKSDRVGIANTATAPEIFNSQTLSASDERIKYFNGKHGQRMWPIIDISDWTLSTAANARLMFELA